MRPHFAITREDPMLELALAEHIDARSALLVCSGGCTPLALHALRPQMRLAVFDLSPAQLSHFQRKASAVGHAEELDRLNASGFFEGLFRVLRQTMLEFVTTETELESFFSEENPSERLQLIQKWFDHPYAMAPYEAALNDSFLHIMFTEQATQHASANSYVRYFADRICVALMDPEAHHNPYLQHIFLGKFLPADAPAYYRSSTPPTIPVHQLPIEELQGLEEIELVSLSNILDWNTLAYGKKVARALESLPSGAHILLRQLNNEQDWPGIFGDQFTLDVELEQHCAQIEREIFYNQYRVLVRQ